MTKIALVLGGLYSHIELIKALRERCYYTILVDYNEYPKAKEFADEHIRESIYDFQFLEKIIKDRNVQAVFSSNLDRTLPVIARLSSIVEIPFYLDYRTSILVTDKIKMKSVLENNKVNIAKWKLIGDYRDVLKTEFRYPIIFKHISGTGSLGLQKANKPNDIEKSFQDCIKETSDDKIIVEEFIEGKEYSIDCFVFGYKTSVYTIRERLKLFVKETNSVVCVGCLVSNNLLDAKTKSSFKEISARVANSFGLKNSPLLVQLINHETLGPIVVEVAARNSGGNAQDLIKIIFKRDIINWSIDAILGKKQNDNEPQPIVNYFYMSALIYAKGGILGECSGFDICLNKQIIESYYLIRSLGDKIPEEVSVKNRVAEVIIKAESIDGLKKKTIELYKTINVKDINGESILSYDYSILKNRNIMNMPRKSIAIMQPYFFPYIGYFQLANAVYKFVFYDDVNYINRSWINRNRIIINNKISYITVQLEQASQNRLIKDISIIDNRQKLIKTIEMSYKKAPFFHQVLPVIKLVMNYDTDKISDLAINSVITVSSYLGLETTFEKSSEYYPETKGLEKAERLIQICNNNNALTYINSIGGQELYDKAFFQKKGVTLKFLKSNIIPYMQDTRNFIPGLSIIDVLMYNSIDTIKQHLKSYELV